MTRRTLNVLILATFASMFAKAQTTKGLTYTIQTGITASSGEHSPLWLSANKQGLSSIEKNNGYFSAGLFQPTDHMKRFSYGFGLELATAYNFTSSFIVQQAYADIRYRGITFSAGSKERQPELINPVLSSGGLTLSGNARPIPQLWVGVEDYWTVPHTNDWLAIRGHIAYGRFTDNNWQKDFATPDAKRTRSVMYHSKAFYFKVGNLQKAPVIFEGGLQMETQFAGNQYANGKKTNLPSKLKDYLKAIIPLPGGEDSPVTEQENIEGNVVGSWHASLSYHSGDWKLRAYYEHYFEDHSMLFLTRYPWKDGLYAFEVTFPKNPFISQFLYEFMGSCDQTRGNKSMADAFLDSRLLDNYYNHGIYTGWQHWGMGLGNPLLTSPIYNTNGQISFYNNRVFAHHFGITGNPTSELSYRMMLSLTRNFGTYFQPYEKMKRQTYGLAELTYTPAKLKGWSFTASYGVDHGLVVGNNQGGMLVIRKSGLLSK
ncbi:capsule assembly Wzi family protein [uncultured Bacteroides sp.]|uniref:capsule assembly Wzi family protein n=1 Tax=uncultured Bacteroides sp. TaxID=162156 RepID=UPI002AAAFFF4|nr:capsule assembly Wzi family protein [uncultured Bacteroides sp.]